MKKISFFVNKLLMSYIKEFDSELLKEEKLLYWGRILDCDTMNTNLICYFSFDETWSIDLIEFIPYAEENRLLKFIPS